MRFTNKTEQFVNQVGDLLQQPRTSNAVLLPVGAN